MLKTSSERIVCACTRANLNFDADSRTPEEAEQLKQQQLKEQKEGKGKWHEGLASDSESAVSSKLSAGRVVAICTHASSERRRISC